MSRSDRARRAFSVGYAWRASCWHASAMLRALPLVPLLALAGCLYLGDRNDPPRLTLATTISHASLGEPVPIRFDARDDSDRDLKITVVVQDERGATPDACRYRQIDSRADLATFVFYSVGTYRIGAVTQDGAGAVGRADFVTIVVDNEPPRFRGGAVAIMSSATVCGSFPAGEPVVLAFTGSVQDGDGPLAGAGDGCPALPSLAYGWRVVGAPANVAPVLTEYISNGRCREPSEKIDGPVLAVGSPSDQVCLWTAAGVDQYRVRFFASDQANPEITLDSPLIEVAPDSPPCISREEPAAGHMIVDHTQRLALQVTGVDDDRDPFGSDGLRYVWSVWRKSDPSWHDVPNYAGDYYLVEPREFNVGEELRVRVEVVDRTGMRAGAACDLMAEDCIVNSCTVPSAAPAQTCRKWRTWVLEPR